MIGFTSGTTGRPKGVEVSHRAVALQAGPYPRRSAEVVYHRPLKFDDEFEVRLGVEKGGRTSVTFGWQLVRGEELCVEGRHTVVHVGDDGRAAPWPELLRAGLGLAQPTSIAPGRHLGA